MDIKVGDYVRTRRGEIFKILTKIKTTYGFCGLTDSSNKKYSTYTFGKGNTINNNIKGKIKKHSKNIIDLIEVGDIVNGYRIDSIDSWGVLVHEARGINKSGFSIPVAQYEEDIKTVETHEQHEQNRYTVERS